MANTINSLTYESNTYTFSMPYGTCATAAATAAKVVTINNFSLETGARITVKFTYANTVASPTLNINNTGARPIYWHGAALPDDQYWKAGAVLDFVYNGSQWDLIGVADISSLENLIGDSDVSTQINNALASYEPKSNVTSKGSATQPVYFDSNGVAQPTSCTLEKSVPNNAVFTDTHYTSKNVVGGSTAALTNGNVYLRHIENGSATSTHKISGSGATTVTTDTSGNIIITSTDNNTTYSNATKSDAGLMSSSDKTKLDGIDEGATKVTVDSALSSTSTNPVQNKVVNSAISNLSTLVGDTLVATQISNAIASKADLDTNGKVPSSQLPSYVDDVLEYSAKSNFPSTGESGKIYVDTATNLTYRWSGSAYVEISPSLALGETSSTAYRGDRGKMAYDHSQSAHFSGNYNDLTNKPNIPTVGNGTIIIKQAGTSKGTFTVNQSGNTTIELTDNDTDTKNTAGSTNSSSKLFLIGATSQAANPQTYSHDTAYVGTDGCLYSNGSKVAIDSDVAALKTLVGDTEVSIQISNAISNITTIAVFG